MTISQQQIKDINTLIQGELYTDEASKIMYATDASVYYEKPAAIVVPKDELDIKTLIDFANKNKTPLIPRAAGTSLAGQVVGNGIVVDISKNLTEIGELDVNKKWIIVLFKL